jgi:hypothetical protein
MIKSAQIEDLLSDEFNYITALTKPQIEKMLRTGLIQMEFFEKTICEIVDGKIRYILRLNPTRATEVKDSREGKLTSLERLCIKRTRYLAEHPRAKVDTARKAIEAFAIKLKIDDWAKARVEERVIHIEIDKAELDKIEKLDGCYVIKSNIPVPDATKETIHDRYKGLSEVEWAFRTMKTTLLHLRGIYVRKGNRTRAHVFTIMLAYMLAYELRRLWHDMEITIEEGIEELSSICATVVVMGDVSIHTVPMPREMGKNLLEKAGVSLPDAIPCREADVFTRKRLVDERKNHIKSKF